MRLTTTASTLRDALGVARRAVVANPQLVAYSGVLLQVTKRSLLVTGSDGETTITAHRRIEDPTEGSALITPRPLASYLATLAPDTIVVCDADDENLRVAAAEADPYSFRRLSATFPTPTLDANDLAQVDLTGLDAAVASVRHAAQGAVQLVSSEDDLILNATDSYRLAQARLPGGGFGDREGVIPLGAIEEMGRHHVSTIGIDAKGRELRARGNDVFISTRLLSTPFPAVDAVVAQIPESGVAISREAFATALGRLAAVTDRAPLRLELTSDALVLSADNVELGAGRERIPLDRDSSSEFTCSVQLAFLQDAVSAHTADTVSLCWSSAQSPVYLTSPSTLTIVMPIRI